MCLQHPLPRRRTHQAESDQRSRGSLRISEQRRSGFRNPRCPDPTVPICPHCSLEEGASLYGSKPAGTAGHKDGHQRQPPGGASIHLVSWVRIGRGTSQPGHLGPLRSEAETPGLCHALPSSPCPIYEHTTQGWPVTQVPGAHHLFTEEQRFI